MRTPRSTPRFAVCIDNFQYAASPELRKIYRVLPDDDAAREGDNRVLDESGDDYLYPEEWFVPVNLPRAVEMSFLPASRSERMASR